ncbi:MAG: cobalamin biosynthesis protein CobN [Candidatus Bathyarchaeum sp.]|nr:MAG: cobalamin biosynthesis protein CobN [Candidatus Bathyarchaeum sp.]
MTRLKLAFLATMITDTVPLISAVESVNKRFGDVVNVRLQTGVTTQDFDKMDEFIKFAKTSHVAIVHLMGTFPDYDQLVSVMKSASVPLLVVSPNKEQPSVCTIDQKDKQKILKYLQYGGKPNFENLLLYLANRFTGSNYEVCPPEKISWEGIYHPDFDRILTFDEYAQKKIVPGKPTVGILFHPTQLRGENTSFVDSLIEAVERLGANVIAVSFGSKLNWVVENCFMKEGKIVVGAIVSTLCFSLTSSNSKALDALNKLGVPVLKTILTVNTFEDWRDSMQGLSLIDIPASVVMPEFDGFLITVPMAAMDSSKINPLTGTKILKFEPIPERVDKVARLSVNWAKLKHIPNSEKKIAIIFHNYPPRNDTIGKAFAIDTPVSVLNLLTDMKNAGYHLDGLPESSQQLIDGIIESVTNDLRWLSAEELAKRAVDKTSGEQYVAWFNELPFDAQNKMEEKWGKPPGKPFSYKGDLLVPGIINGNIFLGLQPPRGSLGDDSASYHSPDLSLSHHYYAYYRWIRDVFKADVVIHVGTHGSLEWLPGKSVGLSASCFPDVAISDLPNVYPYVITNPGEGTQSKRRSYCCIIDYLVPVMHNADTYEQTAELEVQLQEYYQTKLVDAGKLPVLQKVIWETVVSGKLDQDLEVTQEFAFADFDGFLETLHAYLHELADAQLRDGLHTLGQPPADSRLEEFLVTLTRLSNGSVPSLRQSLAELKGYDYEDLLAHKGKLRSDGRTNGDIIKELHNTALELMKQFNSKGFTNDNVDELMQDVLGCSSSKVKQCLLYVSGFLVPALEKTTDELANVLASCEGGYVLPGPSGSITRGMADILPTGRNFYSVDPRSVPSTASWRVGVALADGLLERYLKEEGGYPESVGTILWATDTMKTKGDDLAEILYLMGVKPVWEQSSGRVVGIEAIPLEELKRPRIDVTVRISGLFRDTFPNIVHLLDEAVALVAGLNEPSDKNYVRKHVEKEVTERVAEGVDAEKAREEAHYRVFGDRPGAYGCGVSELVSSKNWETQKDLSDIYVAWGSYAYSRKAYGHSVPERFKARLSQISVTVKNQDSREYDILDCDDWYDVHGGMIVSVKTLSGTAPRSYCGDSSDPDRVKIRSTAEETCHVFRTRLLNPKWISSMVRHDYAGASTLSKTFDDVLGWDATVEVVEDWMYEDLANKYVLDKKMQEWLKEVNPYALQNMVERLLETIGRNLWNATEEMKKELQKLYLEIEGVLEGKNE